MAFQSFATIITSVFKRFRFQQKVITIYFYFKRLRQCKNFAIKLLNWRKSVKLKKNIHLQVREINIL